MTKSELELLKSYCCDRLRLYRERGLRSSNRNPKNKDWNDGIYEGARSIASDIIGFLKDLEVS